MVHIKTRMKLLICHEGEKRKVLSCFPIALLCSPEALDLLFPTSVTAPLHSPGLRVLHGFFYIIYTPISPLRTQGYMQIVFQVYAKA